MHSETESERKVRKDLEDKTRVLWREKLLEANDEAELNDQPHKSEAEIQELAKNTPMRAIYPMLHSSFMLNSQFAEAHQETEGDLSGSKGTFELSNMRFLLGILETLNRSSLVGQLKYIASTVLPGVHEKLKSLADAKNDEGGLPEQLVQKVAKILKSKNTLSGTISMCAEEFQQDVEKFFGAGAESSTRAKFDGFVKDYIEKGPRSSSTWMTHARNRSPSGSGLRTR